MDNLKPRSVVISLKKYKVTISPTDLAPEIETATRPFWKVQDLIDPIFYDNRRQARKIHKALVPILSSHPRFFPTADFSVGYLYSVTYQSPIIHLLHNKCIATSSHSLNAKPTELLSTELLICWKLAELVWHNQEQHGNIEIVLVSVVTDYIRVLRLNMTPEYHRNITSPTETLSINIKNFGLDASELVVQEIEKYAKESG